MRILGSTALSLGTLVLPIMASATTLNDTIMLINKFMNAFVGLFVLAAVLVFFWGLIQYLMEVGTAKSKGLQTMFYGIIAIFVMVSIWGIIALLQSTFGVGGASSITPNGVGVTGL